MTGDMLRGLNREKTSKHSPVKFELEPPEAGAGVWLRPTRGLEPGHVTARPPGWRRPRVPASYWPRPHHNKHRCVRGPGRGCPAGSESERRLNFHQSEASASQEIV